VVDCVVLGVVGANPPEGTWVVIGRIATIWYFLHFIVLLPLLSRLERPRPLPASISQPVLVGGGYAPAAARMDKA
jgi:ubiquinol-cytochrome c reductase cytochrome b/c1 subunit